MGFDKHFIGRQRHAGGVTKSEYNTAHAKFKFEIFNQSCMTLILDPFVRKKVEKFPGNSIKATQ